MQGNTASFPVWFWQGKVRLPYGAVLILQGDRQLPRHYGGTDASLWHTSAPSPCLHSHIILICTCWSLFFNIYFNFICTRILPAPLSMSQTRWSIRAGKRGCQILCNCSNRGMWATRWVLRTKLGPLKEKQVLKHLFRPLIFIFLLIVSKNELFQTTTGEFLAS